MVIQVLECIVVICGTRKSHGVFRGVLAPTTSVTLSPFPLGVQVDALTVAIGATAKGPAEVFPPRRRMEFGIRQTFDVVVEFGESVAVDGVIAVKGRVYLHHVSGGIRRGQWCFDGPFFAPSIQQRP